MFEECVELLLSIFAICFGVTFGMGLAVFLLHILFNHFA
jgi:hypothetical protein